MSTKKEIKSKTATTPTVRSNEIVGRGDHEMISVRGRLIPVLGTVGGTADESRETARNIERFLAANDQAHARPEKS